MAAPNMNEINAKMQQLQAQVESFNKMQSAQPQTASAPAAVEQPSAPASTYPKVFRSDTVEDILNNPQWKQELAVEFNDSELGAKAKSYTELLFMEFCEKQTGRSSTMLADIRQKAQAQEKQRAPRAPKPPADQKEKEKEEEAKG